jgi:acyl-CoA oxidase
VAAYLIKKMTQAVKDPHAPAKDPVDKLFKFYLKNRSTHTPREVVNTASRIIDDKAIVEAFQWRAADLSFRAYQARVVETRPWTKLMVQLHSLSRAYSEQILVTTFYNSLSDRTTTSLSDPTPAVLLTCFRLYSLYTLDTFASSFALTKAVTADSTFALQDVILALMAELRPHAVKLVDAWSIPDWVLDSALGRSDGKVYEDLYDRAHRKNPLNRITFNPDWRNEEIVLGSADGARHLLAKL